MNLLSPARGKANHESVELGQVFIRSSAKHSFITEFLELFHIVSIVAKHSISKAETAVLLALSFSRILGKGHEATFAVVIRHIFLKI
jgi:hypothetical protein